jgi:hypothetical protein
LLFLGHSNRCLACLNLEHHVDKWRAWTLTAG